MNPVAVPTFIGPHRLALFVLSLVLMATVLELVRRNWLKEKYSLLWIFAALCGVFIGIFPGLIEIVSGWLHFQFVTLAYVVSFLFLLGMALAFSVMISKLSERTRKLAQEVALLEHRLRSLENKSTEDDNR